MWGGGAVAHLARSTASALPEGNAEDEPQAASARPKKRVLVPEGGAERKERKQPGRPTVQRVDHEASQYVNEESDGTALGGVERAEQHRKQSIAAQQQAMVQRQQTGPPRKGAPRAVPLRTRIEWGLSDMRNSVAGAVTRMSQVVSRMSQAVLAEATDRVSAWRKSISTNAVRMSASSRFSHDKSSSDAPVQVMV